MLVAWRATVWPTWCEVTWCTTVWPGRARTQRVRRHSSSTSWLCLSPSALKIFCYHWASVSTSEKWAHSLLICKIPSFFDIVTFIQGNMGSPPCNLGPSKSGRGTSLVVQWLRLHAPSAGGTDSIPGQGTKILHATWRGQKKSGRNSSNSGRTNVRSLWDYFW